ncbi:MAG: rhodanese-like domain-containing protein [Verrucomicrobiota bacterium]|nr:rhodanese-like domain-containing protein [Verrucomicrobiota bacterium]
MEIIRPHSAPRAPRARLAIMMTALIVLAAGFGFSKTSAFQWFWLKASLRTHFPRVQWITTQELADWLADKHRQQPILLDVRTVDEWSVSHIPGGQRIDPKASAEQALPSVAKDAPVVTYCAVGYRSGEMATRLGEAGFTNVRNLEGSIFQWANEHRPLVRDGEPAKHAHPYHAFWGRLLDDDVRAPVEK